MPIKINSIHFKYLYSYTVKIVSTFIPPSRGKIWDKINSVNSMKSPEHSEWDQALKRSDNRVCQVNPQMPSWPVVNPGSKQTIHVSMTQWREEQLLFLRGHWEPVKPMIFSALWVHDKTERGNTKWRGDICLDKHKDTDMNARTHTCTQNNTCMHRPTLATDGSYHTRCGRLPRQMDSNLQWRAYWDTEEPVFSHFFKAG